MGGIRVANLPFVSGMEGAPADLFLSWFYDRYNDTTRVDIRRSMRAHGYTHWLLSWPDARAHGCSLVRFKALCQELIDDGFFPCVMLCSKDFDNHEVADILAGLQPVLDALVGLVPMFCVGWELSLWQNPTTCQELIDAIAPRCLKQPGTLVYVHFQEGYPSFQQPGGAVADFWKLQQGKLTGLLYQKIIVQNDAQFLDSLYDCLVRFAGGFNMPTGFDFVALELSVMTQFAGSCSEAEGDRIGRLAVNAPAVNGKSVDGSGNGS
jgi:hypothetical protein